MQAVSAEWGCEQQGRRRSSHAVRGGFAAGGKDDPHAGCDWKCFFNTRSYAKRFCARTLLSCQIIVHAR